MQSAVQPPVLSSTHFPFIGVEIIPLLGWSIVKRRLSSSLPLVPWQVFPVIGLK
jgi:uncharacterized membrane protein